MGCVVERLLVIIAFGNGLDSLTGQGVAKRECSQIVEGEIEPGAGRKAMRAVGAGQFIGQDFAGCWQPVLVRVMGQFSSVVRFGISKMALALNVLNEGALFRRECICGIGVCNLSRISDRRRLQGASVVVKTQVERVSNARVGCALL